MANDFKTRKTLGGGKVVTRKGSKYETDNTKGKKK